MDVTKTSAENIDLPPGYYAERSEAGTYLMDPEGRRVMRLPRHVSSEDHRSEEPESEEWRELCRMLLVQLSQQHAAYERLRSRVAQLDRQLEAAEAERDQTNAIAEDLYDFFRRRVREVVDRKEKPSRRDTRLRN